MIARHAKVRELVRRKLGDGSVGHHATVLADASELTLPITAAEFDLLGAAIDRNARFVLTISEEAVS